MATRGSAVRARLVRLLALVTLFGGIAALAAGGPARTSAQAPTPTPFQPPPLQPNTLVVTVAAGWNLISGPTGTVVSGLAGPLYTLRAGDAAYVAVPPGTPLQAGSGYWALFDAPTTFAINSTDGPTSVSFPAPAGKIFMVGNPFTTLAQILGANDSYVFNPMTNSYGRETLIPPGRGAWVRSNADGMITLRLVPPPPAGLPRQ